MLSLCVDKLTHPHECPLSVPDVYFRNQYNNGCHSCLTLILVFSDPLCKHRFTSVSGKTVGIYFTHISLLLASSCRTSLFLSSLSSSLLFSASSIIQRWQLLLSSASSDRGMLGLVSPPPGSLGMAPRSPRPSLAYNSRCGLYSISSVSSEVYKDSGRASNFH